MTRTSADQPTAGRSTRERILDIALDLFTEQGFDGTSLQEIADRLGVTKAALYYHFRSKDEILRALHQRVHEVGRRGLDSLLDRAVDLESWAAVMDDVTVQIVAQRQLFMLHQRNQAALERLHANDDHDADHEDMQDRLRRILAQPELPLRDRVRMACSFGALTATFFLTGDGAEISDGELVEQMRAAIRALLFG